MLFDVSAASKKVNCTFAKRMHRPLSVKVEVSRHVFIFTLVYQPTTPRHLVAGEDRPTCARELALGELYMLPPMM